MDWRSGPFHAGQALCRSKFIDKLYVFYMECIDGTLLVFVYVAGNDSPEDRILTDEQ